MKRASSILLAAMLLLVAATCSLGAVKNIGGDFYSESDSSYWVDYFNPRSVDTWFSIAPDTKRVKLIGGSIENVGSGFAAEYYLNDQMFASVASLTNDGGLGTDSFTTVKGSYLFGFGLFLGLEYATYDTDNYFVFSPGYRFNFGDDSYLAISADYFDGDGYSDMMGYEINAKYFTDNLKFYGGVYMPDENYDSTDLYLLLGVNFQVSDTVVIGLMYYDEEDNSEYTLGFTWTLERFILDFKYYADDDDDTSYELGGMFLINEAIGVGLGYLDEDWLDDAQLSVKFKYVTDTNEFSFIYKLENDSYPNPEYYLTYTMYL
jgi:hypothetical protein